MRSFFHHDLYMRLRKQYDDEQLIKECLGCCVDGLLLMSSNLNVEAKMVGLIGRIRKDS
jgi:hypothetical protein